MRTVENTGEQRRRKEKKRECRIVKKNEE